MTQNVKFHGTREQLMDKLLLRVPLNALYRSYEQSTQGEALRLFLRVS